MATDLERLIVRLEAQLTRFDRDMSRASRTANNTAAGIERRFRQMESRLSNVGANLARGLFAPLAGFTTYAAVREVQQFADAWTLANNRLEAASQIAGRHARSLSELAELANSTRSAFEPTVQLYARMLVATASVAENEQQVATATRVVQEAFRAYGATTTEAAAATLQLGQALASGYLQGDELRSIRENAPLLAQAIANEFGVSIGALKELGAEGEITADRIFKAILDGEQTIHEAFLETDATIQDGLTRVRNALLEYIGTADDGLSATEKISQALNWLADNFTEVADAALALAAVIAGALLGRGIVGLIRMLGTLGAGLMGIITLLRGGAVAAGVFSAALGPLGLVLGAVGVGLALLASRQTEAERAAEEHQKWLDELNRTTSDAEGMTQEYIDQLITEREAQLRAAEAAAIHAQALYEVAAAQAAGALGPGGAYYQPPGVTAVPTIPGNNGQPVPTIDPNYPGMQVPMTQMPVDLWNTRPLIGDPFRTDLDQTFREMWDNALLGERANIEAHVRALAEQAGRTYVPPTAAGLTPPDVNFGQPGAEALPPGVELQGGAVGVTGADAGLVGQLEQQATQARERVDALNASIARLREMVGVARPDNGGGPPGGGGSERESYLEREIRQMQESIAMSEAKARALGMTRREQIAAAKAQELFTAAERDGLQLTPELVAYIQELAGAYADAEMALEQLTEQYEMAAEAAEDFRDTSASILKGFIGDLLEGISVVEALGNALMMLGNKLIASGIDRLFGHQWPGLGGGRLGDRFFARNIPKLARGGITNGVSIAGEAGPEAVVPLSGGRRIPVDLRLPAFSGGGGGHGVDFRPVMNVVMGGGGDSEDLMTKLRRLLDLRDKKWAELLPRLLDRLLANRR